MKHKKASLATHGQDKKRLQPEKKSYWKWKHP